MLAGTHRIRRQHWQVSVISPGEAFALRQALRAQFDTVLLPAFQRAFDALGAGDEVVHIPRLTLKLQLRGGEDLVAALARLIEKQLEQILAPAVAARPARGMARRLPPQISRRRMLMEYLASGRIAWYAATLDAPDLLPLLREAAHLLAAEPQATLRSLGGSLEARIAASFRLLQLLDATPRAALLEQVADDDASGTAPLRTTLRRVIAAPQLGAYRQLRLASLLLALRADDLKPPLPAALVTLLRECVAPLVQLGIVQEEFGINLLTTSATTTFPAARHVPSRGIDSGAAASADSSRATDAGAATSADNSRATDARAAMHADSSRATDAGAVARADRLQATDVGTAAHDDGLATTAAEEHAAATTNVAAERAAAAESHLVNHAGVVLLHPFLPRLFEAIGIAPEGPRALDTAHLPRAAALLHWLATGCEEVFEFELAFIKVLLGLTPDVPLPVAGGLLSGGDRVEADALLAAAIEHWRALGNTSIAGLRVSFLQRRGLLRDEASGWQLHVETRSFDVLLGKLPWSISMMKLPWMTKPIITDWPTP
jgi:Contractile injection system tape measure protein